MISQQDIRVLLADSYYTFAKIEGMDMRRVAEILEALRPHFTDQPDYNVWKKIPFDTADLDNDDLIQMLVKLRFDYYSLVSKSIIKTVQQISVESKEKGFIAWLKFYTEAIIHWESLVYDRIDDATFDLLPDDQDYIRSSQKYHDYIRDNRWGDCYERYLALAENVDLPSMYRAMIYCIAAQIQIYFRLDMEKALDHLENAKQLAPAPDSKIERVFGEWYQKKLDFVTARMYFMNAMSIDLSDTDAIIAMGDSYRDERNLDVAEEYYQKAISKNPLDSSAYDRLLYLYGDPEKFGEKEHLVHQMLHKIEVINLNMPDKRYSNWRYNGYRAVGFVYYNNKNYKKAAEWYNKAIKLQPGWASAHIDLGNTWYEAKDYEAAKKHYEKALAANPESYEACWALGNYFERVSNFKAAISYYQKCIQIRPYAEKDLLLIIADIYINQLENYAEANHFLMDLQARYPDDPVVLEKLATAHGKSGNSQESEKFFRRALEINPNSNNNWNELGIIHYRRNEFDKAAIFFEKALEIAPDEPIYYDNLADAYQNSNESGKLKEVLELSAAKFPHNGLIYNRLGNYYYTQEDYNKALKAYQKAVEYLPNDAVVKANLAGVYKILGNWADAGKYYQEALLHAPENDTYMNEAGVAAFRAGDYPAAALFFKKAAEQQPENPTYFDNLAQAYLEIPDKTAEAEQAYLTALRLSPDNDLIQNRLGNLYLLVQKYDLALKHYQIAAELKPDHPIYAANEGYTQLFLENSAEAVKQLEKAVSLNNSISTIHNWLAMAYLAQGDAKKGADYLLEKMSQTDDPAFLKVFLEIYGKTTDASHEYAQKALQIIQKQPLINAEYEAILESSN